MRTGKRGGVRPGSGRKPKAATLLKRKIIKQKGAEAEYAFALFCRVMRDGKEPTTMRLEAARVVMDQVWGKPMPRVPEGTKSVLLVVGHDGD